jgi:hypothetical protein
MKTAIAFTFLLLLHLSCSSLSDEGKKNEALARKMFEAFNQHNWEAMAAYYSDFALFLDPSLGKEYVKQTRNDVIEKYKGYQQMFPDIQDNVKGIYPSGDKVTVEFVSTGHSRDSLSFTLPIISVLAFKNGLIVKDATYYDLENP